MNSFKTYLSPQAFVLYTNSIWDSPMVYLRVRGPAQQAGLRLVQGNNQGEWISPEQVSSVDYVVIQRDFPRYKAAYEQVITRARGDGKRVVYEIDDLLIDMPPDHSHREDYQGILLQLIRAILEADAIVVSSELLAVYLHALNSNTWVFPNYLNDQLWTFRNPKEPSDRNFPVVIGYIGGETHQLDIASISTTLIKVLKRHSGKVRMRFWGGRPPAELLNSPWVEWIPLNELDYAKFARFSIRQDCDVFIAPLRDNLFNQSKSAIKYLEYSAHGVPGVFSSISAYESIIDNGVNGFLASTIEDWEKYLDALVCSPELRYQVGLQAQETVKSRWLLSQHSHEWVDIFQKAIDPGSISEQAHQDKTNLLRIITLIEKHQQELEVTILQKNAQISEASDHQLREIRESRSWRLVQKLQHLRLWFVPLGSRREKLLKSLHLLND